MEYIITVMSRDRPGIIAGIGKAVYEMGGNIEEISQTVVRHRRSIACTEPESRR